MTRVNNYLCIAVIISSELYTTMSFFSGGTTAAATNTSATAEKDIEVSDPPTDSISSLSFSSQADYLAVGSWDNSVRQV